MFVGTMTDHTSQQRGVLMTQAAFAFLEQSKYPTVASTPFLASKAPAAHEDRNSKQ
jgi:hypothetical protein